MDNTKSCGQQFYTTVLCYTIKARKGTFTIASSHFLPCIKSPVLFIDDVPIGKGSVASLLNITKANFCVVLLINKQK